MWSKCSDCDKSVSHACKLRNWGVWYGNCVIAQNRVNGWTHAVSATVTVTSVQFPHIEYYTVTVYSHSESRANAIKTQRMRI